MSRSHPGASLKRSFLVKIIWPLLHPISCVSPRSRHLLSFHSLFPTTTFVLFPAHIGLCDNDAEVKYHCRSNDRLNISHVRKSTKF